MGDVDSLVYARNLHHQAVPDQWHSSSQEEEDFLEKRAMLGHVEFVLELM